MVVVDASCLKQVDSQPKSCGLVWGSAATWRCSTFISWTEWTLAMTWSWWQHYKYRRGYYYYYYPLFCCQGVNSTLSSHRETAELTFRIGPEQVTHWSVVRHFLFAINCAYLIKSLNGRRQSAVYTKYLSQTHHAEQQPWLVTGKWQKLNQKSCQIKLPLFFDTFYFRSAETVCCERHVSQGSK